MATVFILCERRGMKSFIALKDGTIVNISALAYIHPTPGPQLPNTLGGIEIVFPSIATSEGAGTESYLTLTLHGAEADDFLSQLAATGVDVTKLQESRKDLGKTLSGRIARELSQ
jgi:hypothetical protein